MSVSFLQATSERRKEACVAHDDAYTSDERSGRSTDDEDGDEPDGLSAVFVEQALKWPACVRALIV